MVIHFAPEYLSSIVSGDKACTIRYWKQNPPRPGDVVTLKCGNTKLQGKVGAIATGRLGDMSQRNLADDGFGSVEEAVEGLGQFYKTITADDEVTYIEWELIGGAPATEQPAPEDVPSEQEGDFPAGLPPVAELMGECPDGPTVDGLIASDDDEVSMEIEGGLEAAVSAVYEALMTDSDYQEITNQIVELEAALAAGAAGLLEMLPNLQWVVTAAPFLGEQTRKGYTRRVASLIVDIVKIAKSADSLCEAVTQCVSGLATAKAVYEKQEEERLHPLQPGLPGTEGGEPEEDALGEEWEQDEGGESEGEE